MRHCVLDARCKLRTKALLSREHRRAAGTAVRMVASQSNRARAVCASQWESKPDSAAIGT
jgi:hypothetical protein